MTSPQPLADHIAPVPFIRRQNPQRRATVASYQPAAPSSLQGSSALPQILSSDNSSHSQISSQINPAPRHDSPQPLEQGSWKIIFAPLGTSHYYYHTSLRVVVDTSPDGNMRREIERSAQEERLDNNCEWYRRKDGNIFYINHNRETATLIVGSWRRPSNVPPQETTPNLDAYKNKYWEFVRKHPFHLATFRHTVSKEAKNEALNSLSLILGMHALGQRHPILAPFSKTQCLEMRDILTSDPVFQPGDKRFCTFEYRTYIIAAILEQIYAQRYWCKAQSKGDAVAQPPQNASWFMKAIKYVLYSLLLGIPVHHQKQVEKIKNVRIGKEEIPQHYRKEIIEKTKVEHSISLIVAGLLLAASLAMMAIPGVDSRTLLFAGVAAQCGFSSVLINIAALWQYVGTLEDDVISGRHYFKRNLVLISCLQSLPFATMLWGLFNFCLALFNFPWKAERREEITGKPEALLKPGHRITSSVTMGLLAIAIAATIIDVAYMKLLAIKSKRATIQQGADIEMQHLSPTYPQITPVPSSPQTQQGGGTTVLNDTS